MCVEMKLKTIFSAYRSVQEEGAKDFLVNFLLVFDVWPSSAVFESTVTYAKNEKFEISGSVSRLNDYSGQSSCVNTKNLTKYCFCHDSSKPKLMKNWNKKGKLWRMRFLNDESNGLDVF
jgi:hypothetical protein